MAFYTDQLAKDAGFVARVAAKMSDWLGAFAEALSRRRLQRVTFNELISLSDAELADLGIARAQIRRIAKEAARAKS